MSDPIPRRSGPAPGPPELVAQPVCVRLHQLDRDTFHAAGGVTWLRRQLSEYRTRNPNQPEGAPK